MINLEQLRELAIKNASKIVLLVVDGLGGLPGDEGLTELEAARTPNLDRLAKVGSCGLTIPVSPGITPGSGPAHLALFGYDPVKYLIGRGVLEALGIGFNLRDRDVAARGNFCTVGRDGIITDRRAGRISTDYCTRLCDRLQKIVIGGVKLFVVPVKEHRFVLVLRGDGLRPELGDTDPQREGLAPLSIVATHEIARHTAGLVEQFIDSARGVLKDSDPANMVTLRGFSQKPDMPSIGDIFGLRAAAIAAYPMYKGLAKLVGMEVIATGAGIEDELAAIEENYGNFDFFYMHVKGADSAGEDGDFSRKVNVIEQVDSYIPAMERIKPDVLIIMGDHSTPAIMKSHSWHPVPFVLYSKWCYPDGLSKFSERNCLKGSLGIFSALAVMPLAMANALRLTKYGA